MFTLGLPAKANKNKKPNQNKQTNKETKTKQNKQIKLITLANENSRKQNNKPHNLTQKHVNSTKAAQKRQKRG